MPDETPTLHLSLSDDERLNRNWELLDQFFTRLASPAAAPGDLDVLGNLTVAGNATIAGTLQAGVAHFSGPVDVAGLLTLNGGLAVTGGPVSFPDLSIDGTDLKKGATIQAFETGPEATGTQPLTFTDQELAVTLDDGMEDIGRTSLVIAQVVLNVGLVSDAPGGPSICNATFSIWRGAAPGAMIASRRIGRTQKYQGFIEIPLTFMWVGLAPGAAQKRWAIKGRIDSLTMTSSVTYASIVALQLR